MKFTYRLTKNDPDFAGSIEMQDGKPVAEVYSTRYLLMLSKAPEMVDALLEARKVIEAYNPEHTLLSIIDALLEQPI